MKIIICAIIKNEHKYLQEWIDWHLNLGFDAIYLFEDVDSDSHLELLSDYKNVYLQKISDLFGTKKRFPKRLELLYDTFLYKKPDADWVLFIDADEFLYINGDLKSLLMKYQDYNGLYVACENYNANGHISSPEELVQKNYTKKVWLLKKDLPNLSVKSFCNISKNPTLKTMHLVNNGVNSSFNPDHTELKYDKIYLKHYITKSFEDYFKKLYYRGDAMGNHHRTLKDFFDLNLDLSKDECYEYIETKYNINLNNCNL